MTGQEAATQRMIMKPIPGVGLELRGLDVRTASDAEVFAIAALLLRHALLVVRNQNLNSSEHVAFSERFGRLEYFPPRPGHDDGEEPWARYIFKVSSHSSHGYRGVGLYWHTDGYFHEHPTAVSIMRPVNLPESGGDTLFADMRKVLAELPCPMRQRIAGMVGCSRPAPETQRSGLFSSAAVPGVRQSLIRHHPVTGHEVLYLNPRNMASIEGLTRSEADDLIRQLLDHVDSSNSTYRHRWCPGDLVIWDNASAAHQATVPDTRYLRLMERTTIHGDEFFYSAFWKHAGRLAETVAGAGDLG